MCLPEVLTGARTQALTRSWHVTSQAPVSQEAEATVQVTVNVTR